MIQWSEYAERSFFLDSVAISDILEQLSCGSRFSLALLGKRTIKPEFFFRFIAKCRNTGGYYGLYEYQLTNDARRLFIRDIKLIPSTGSEKELVIGK